MSTWVDTGAEGMLSTIVNCGVKPGCRIVAGGGERVKS